MKKIIMYFKKINKIANKINLNLKSKKTQDIFCNNPFYDDISPVFIWVEDDKNK